MGPVQRVLAYSEPAAHDVFDPKPAGVNPYTLEQLERAAEHARNAVGLLADVMEGCMTPLDLKAEHETVLKMSAVLERLAPLVSGARGIIAADEPLAKLDDGRSWLEDHPNPVLKLSAIRRLAAKATEDELAPSITYRQAIEDLGLVPAIAAERITPESREYRAQQERVERRAAKRERYELHQQLLEDMERFPCNTCGSESGDPCRTKTNRITTPHAERRKASPLAQQHPAEALQVHRNDTDRDWTPEPGSAMRHRGPVADPEQSSADAAHKRESAARAASQLASKWSDLGR